MKRNILVGKHAYRVARMDFGICSGMLKGETREIVVSTERGHDHADETLFHELFHACELELVEGGQLERQSEERYVEDMATLLFRTLVRNGMLCVEMEWDQLEIDWVVPPKEVT